MTCFLLRTPSGRLTLSFLTPDLLFWRFQNPVTVTSTVFETLFFPAIGSPSFSFLLKLYGKRLAPTPFRAGDKPPQRIPFHIQVSLCHVFLSAFALFVSNILTSLNLYLYSPNCGFSVLLPCLGWWPSP